MTEQTVPFGGTAVAEPPAPVVPLDGDDTSGDAGNRRKLLLAGGGALLLVVVIAAYFLLKGGGSASDSSFVVPHHAVPKPSASAPAAKKPLTLPKKFKGTVGRDPFKALYVQPSAAPAGASTTTTGGSAGTSTSTGSTSTTTTTTTNGSTGTTTAAAPSYHPVWLKLERIWPKSAVFSVGYSNGSTLKAIRYRVLAPKQGEQTVFAKVFALLGETSTQVAVQFGDGTPFILDRTHNFMVVD